MEHANEPLAARLRNAALDRSPAGSERVDDFVLDADGVVDLRDVARTSCETSIAAPAAALATIRGQLGDAAEVTELYADPEPERSRWRFGPRSRIVAVDTPVDTEPAAVPFAPAPPRVAPPISRLSLVPLTLAGPSTDLVVEPTPVTEETPPHHAATPEIDLRGEARPTAECPQCAGVGRRDLFDRVSQVEYFSCDVCSHMWQRDRS